MLAQENRPVVDEYREPRVWWTKLNREAFDPLFESRDDAIRYYKPGERLMRVFEQPDICNVE